MPGQGKTDPERVPGGSLEVPSGIINVLAVFGSPRPGGNSSVLHEAFLHPFETEGSAALTKIHVYDEDIRPCTACGHCRDMEECIFDDAMAPLYPLIRGARLLSLSSPLYFSSFPGPLKNFIDRCQVLWESRERGSITDAKKTGIFLATGGGNYRDMFLPSVTSVRHFFRSLGCSFLPKDFILVPDCDTRPVSENAALLAKAGAIGKEYLKVIKEF